MAQPHQLPCTSACMYASNCAAAALGAQDTKSAHAAAAHAAPAEWFTGSQRPGTTEISAAFRPLVWASRYRVCILGWQCVGSSRSSCSLGWVQHCGARRTISSSGSRKVCAPGMPPSTHAATSAQCREERSTCKERSHMCCTKERQAHKRNGATQKQAKA
jgi:hypothetical protein